MSSLGQMISGTAHELNNPLVERARLRPASAVLRADSTKRPLAGWVWFKREAEQVSENRAEPAWRSRDNVLPSTADFR